ncbi:hypothetical protein KAU33_07730 [Candidatus Dependentiae bacterium]|nr:hypothetical protein [Candidatus Dependentiae bacterium]
MKKHFLISIFVAIFVVSAIIMFMDDEKPNKEKSILKIEEQFFDLYNSGNYSQLVELYFYCADPGSDKRESLKKRLELKFEILDEIMGKLDQVVNHSGGSMYRGIRVHGDSLDCISWQKKVEEFQFKVYFSIQGEGFIFLNLCKEGDELKILDTSFLFTTSNQPRTETIRKIKNKFAELEREPELKTPSISKEVLKVTKLYFKNISSKKFTKASKLFYFDPNLDKQLRSHQEKYIRIILSNLDDEFGGIETFELYNGQGTYDKISFTGFNLKDATGPVIMAITTVTYKVKFSKEGYGFITFDMIQVPDGYDIMEIYYGLPSKRIDAKQRLQEINTKIIQDQQTSGFTITTESTDNEDVESLETKLKTFIDKYNFRHFDICADLFHYNPAYTETELELEKKKMIKYFEVFWDEFGTVESNSLLLTSTNFLSVAVMPNDIDYWNKALFPGKQLYYQVKFSKEGNGYIEIVSCQTKKGLQLKSISFGLPVDRKNAKERILDISNKIK